MVIRERSRLHCGCSSSLPAQRGFFPRCAFLSLPSKSGHLVDAIIGPVGTCRLRTRQKKFGGAGERGLALASVLSEKYWSGTLSTLYPEVPPGCFGCRFWHRVR